MEVSIENLNKIKNLSKEEGKVDILLAFADLIIKMGKDPKISDEVKLASIEIYDKLHMNIPEED
jgi:hypothetical protein